MFAPISGTAKANILLYDIPVFFLGMDLNGSLFRYNAKRKLIKEAILNPIMA